MILLDTQVFLWALTDDKRIGPEARRVIAAADARYLSSISHVELAIKSADRKLRLPLDYAQQLAALGIDELPFTNRHAAKVGDWAGRDLDPFDRMLLAQASTEGLMLVTAHRVLRTFDATFDATK